MMTARRPPGALPSWPVLAILAGLAFYSLRAAVALLALCIIWRVIMRAVFDRERRPRA